MNAKKKYFYVRRELINDYALTEVNLLTETFKQRFEELLLAIYGVSRALTA